MKNIFTNLSEEDWTRGKKTERYTISETSTKLTQFTKQEVQHENPERARMQSHSGYKLNNW